MQVLKSALFIFCFLIVAGFSQAQAQDSSIKGGGAGFFSIGYANFETNVLNDFLPEGTSDLSNNHVMIGGGGHSYFGDFIIGGSGFGVGGETISTDSFETNATGGMGFLNLGYRVIHAKKFALYPLLGIGGGAFGLEIREDRDLDVETIKADPGQSIEIHQQGLLLDLSLNAEFYPLSGGKDGSGKGGWLTGIKVGYMYQPFASEDWETETGNISGGPEFNLNGFYAQLTIGGFGMAFEE